MKKTYFAPQMEIYRFQAHQRLLEASDFIPQDWNGGGSAGGRLLENDGLDVLMGGDINELQNMLQP